MLDVVSQSTRGFAVREAPLTSLAAGTALGLSQIQAHCFTEAGDCCPYIAIYKTDTFLSGGALTSFAQQALGQDNTTCSIQKHLGRVLPISSNFFLVFVFFRSVYLPIQRLILPHPGIICWAVRRYLCVFG